MKKISWPFYTWIRSLSIDWRLLIFLLLFFNVKLIIKIAAVFFIYLLRPNFKFGFSLKNSRLPLFYILVIVIGILNWLATGLIGNLNYGLVLVTGIFFWILCILAIHQVKLSVEENSIEKLHRTIFMFFIINAVFSLAVYAGIIWETGAINPYRYQGDFQKYFMGTGDYIKGISFDTSTTNAILNALGVIYFLFNKKNAMVLLCMAVLLLTGSNITNLFLCAVLIFVFLFQSNRNQKSIIVVCFIMLVTFLVKVSPQNNKYLVSAYEQLFNIKKSNKGITDTNIPITQKADSLLTSEEKKQKIAQLHLDSINLLKLELKQNKVLAVSGINIRPEFEEKPEIPVPSIHTHPFQHIEDTTAMEMQLMSFLQKNSSEMPIAAGIKSNTSLPGKVVAFQQVLRYLGNHPVKILTGSGIGNFSSKLAFRTTGMAIAGWYPGRAVYINEDFKSNHLDLYLYYFTGKDELHSVTNSPNSTYGQLLSEYGIAGLLSFLLFYFLFFGRKLKLQAAGIPVLLFALGVFSIDYWFEQLSVVVFIELLLLLNIKELITEKKSTNHVA